MPPLNLVGDFGGGGLLLAFGIVCGIVEAARSGTGQVIDAAMVDGAALLAGMMHGLRASGEWGQRGTNLLDTGAWFYEVYETADGGYISLGPIDSQSCQEMLRIVGLAPSLGDLQYFLKVAGRQGSLLQPKIPKQAALQLRTGFPTGLVIIAGVLAFLIAIDEVLFAPLRWGQTRLSQAGQG